MNQDNPWLQLAYNFVMQTNQSVFLTGKAGTGKTTFLKQLKESCFKQMAVLAPTGVAAINAGGTTIHSFFQLPFAPYIPMEGAEHSDEVSNQHSLIANLRLNSSKRELLKSLDLLVIDEISMVRCDTMDAIDAVLRHVRHNPAPFGGLQMLLIGDMYQLPPVVRDQEWQLLKDFYQGPFFFNSRVVQQQPPVYIELQTIYRQSDRQFIQLLNEVRNNALTQQGLTLLNSRYCPGFEPPENIKYITLTTHNQKADAINGAALHNLSGKPWTYTATVTGDFNERSFPAEEILQLKLGAQVMFLKNDPVSRSYYNGKIGVVCSLDDDVIKVQCEGDKWPIDVKPDVWRNMQYQLNRQTKQVEETELGAFTQFPLRLAWAVTIHKSQGLTFEHAIIDAAYSFSAGQVYVALSRCTSLEGMVLLSKVPQSAVRVDERVQQFSAGSKPVEELQQFFAQSQIQFQQQLLLQLFDGDKLLAASKAIQQLLQQQHESFGEAALPWCQQLVLHCSELKTTSSKFQQQMQLHFKETNLLPEKDDWIQQRVTKGAVWFAEKLEHEIVHSIKNQTAITDSKEQAEELEALLAKAFEVAKQWLQLVKACGDGFDATAVLQAKSKININEIVGLVYSGSGKHKHQKLDSPHPELLSELVDLRNQICAASGRPVYMVANSITLQQLAMYLPQTTEDLLKVKGFGAQRVKQFGDDFLQVIQAYCALHQLASAMPEVERKPQKKSKSKTTSDSKPATRQISYNLWREGKTIAEIAAERNLQPTTIEGHLVAYVVSGEVPRQVLIEDALFEKALAIYGQLENPTMSMMKEQMGDSISYGQIRLVMHWLAAADGSKQHVAE